MRLYFIVLHPACSASRCWHLMTVLAKQRSPLALCCLRSRLLSPPSGLLCGRKPGWSQIIIQYSRNNSMIFPIPGGKKIGSHYLPRYTRYRVIAGRVIKGGHCTRFSTDTDELCAQFSFHHECRPFVSSRIRYLRSSNASAGCRRGRGYWSLRPGQPLGWGGRN